MANAAVVSPLLMTEPGFLYWAPVGTAVPTHTVVGSVFTDSWTGAWVPLGAPRGGTTLTASLTVEPIDVAELIDPVAYRSTGRTFTIDFALANITASNLARAMTTTPSVVSGATTTLLTKISPAAPGSEVRAAFGFESL